MRIILLFASIFGAISVSMAAVGAHLLQPELNNEHLFSAYQKAVDYSLANAIFLLAIAAIHLIEPRLKLILSGYIMLIGGAIFQGALFIYSIFNIPWVAYFTPIGGTLMIIAWLMIAVLVLKNYSLIKK